MDSERKAKLESLFVRSPRSIKKGMEIRPQGVNARISFDLCPEIENALKEKGIPSKFKMNTEEKPRETDYDKTKSLYEFEDLEAVCNKSMNVFSETTQLYDMVEPSGFWNNSLEGLLKTDSTTNSFETACASKNTSFFTATEKSGGFLEEEFHEESQQEFRIEESKMFLEDFKENSKLEDFKEDSKFEDLNLNSKLENFKENSKFEDSIENSQFEDSIIVLNDTIDQSHDFSTKPLQFNDTLEEIEFIMTKGKAYIENVVEKVTVSRSGDKENMFKSKLPTPSSKTPFKKPLSHISSVKKIDFNHIRSPIGEYIKNTTKSPMILSAKPDGFLKAPRNEANEVPKRNPSTIGTQTLPKKAYFAGKSKKCIIDERPASVVPGGPKIQNHLKSSRLMGVVRHDGKIRMSPKVVPHTSPQVVHPMEDSFCNLSLASGDVSLYTIKK
ncbi:sip2 family protein [Megaselia abdita]